ERDGDEDHRHGGDRDEEPHLAEELLQGPRPSQDGVNGLEANGEHPAGLVEEAGGLPGDGEPGGHPYSSSREPPSEEAVAGASSSSPSSSGSRSSCFAA